MAHHERNRLYFDEEAAVPNVTSSTIRRRYEAPSVAIVNACGVAKPLEDDFVRQFNRRGVSAVVTTTTTVDARMAGRFMALFAEAIDEHESNVDYSLGRAVFETVRRLSREEDDAGRAYGARALVYGVVGNSNVRLCSP